MITWVHAPSENHYFRDFCRANREYVSFLFAQMLHFIVIGFNLINTVCETRKCRVPNDAVITNVELIINNFGGKIKNSKNMR